MSEPPNVVANAPFESGEGSHGPAEALSALPDPVYALDREGRLTWWSDGFADATGRGDEPLEGRPLTDLVADGDVERVERALAAVVEGETTERWRAALVDVDGDRRMRAFSGGPLTDDSGAVVGVVGTARPVDDDRGDGRSRYGETVLDTLPDVAFVVDRDRRLEWANRRLEDALGTPRAELIGRPLADLVEEVVVDPDAAADYLATVDDVLAGNREAARIELPAETDPLGEHVVEIRLRPYAPDREIEGVVGDIRDVSDRRERERQLRELKTEYETVFENAHDGLFLVDVEWDGEGAGKRPEFEYARAYRPEEGSARVPSDPEARGRTPRAVYGDELGAQFERSYRRCLDAGETISFEEDLDIDGETRVFRTRLTPVVVDGEVTHIVGSSRDVTERKARERELERTRELLSQSHRLARAGGWEVDLRTEPPEVSMTDELARIIGLEPGTEMDLETAVEFYHPEDRPRVRAAIERAVEDADPSDLEARLLTVDDDRLWVRVISEPILEDGEVVSIRGSLQDVTERKERERALERQTERFERVLETSPVGITIVDADGRIVRANDRAEDVLGLTEAEITDRTYDDPQWRIVDADGDPIPSEDLPFRRVMDTGRPVFDYRHAIEWPDGSVRWLSINAAPLRGRDGDIQGVVNAVRDITERRERKRELQETAQRLNLALRATETGVWEWNIETDEVVWSESLQRMLGIEPGTFDGTFEAHAEYLHPDDVPKVERAAEEALDGDGVFDVEFRMLREDGERIWVHGRGELVTGDGPKRMVGVTTDVTDRRKRERELRKLKAEYETVFENAQDGLFLVEIERTGDAPEFRYVHAYRPEGGSARVPSDAEAHGRTPREVYGDELGAQFERNYRRCLDAGETISFEEEISVGSETSVFQTSLTPVSIDGEIVEIVGSSRDITERKERERALQTERDRLSALFENARSGIVRYELDGDGCFARDVNPAFLDVFGYDREEVVDARLEELIVPPDEAAGSKEVVSRLRQGTPVETEVTRMTSDGPRDFLLRSVPICSEPPCDRGYALYTDITDRKRRERELERQRDELETFTSISALIQEITRTLVDARDREEIERIVCERLADASFYGNAWVVEEDVAGDGLVARVDAGGDEELRRAITDSTGPTEGCRVREALETGDVRAFEDVRDDPTLPDGLREALVDRGHESALAVPLVHRSTVYGVLVITAGEPTEFSERERDAFAVLGEVVGFAINAIRNEKLVHADAAVEFEVEVADPDLFLSAVSDRFDCAPRMEGAVRTGDGGTLCYVSVEDVPPDRVIDAAADIPGVDAMRRVADHDEGALFEFRTSDSLLDALAEGGASLVDASAESGMVDLVARAPVDVDLRSLLATLDRRFDRADLVARREVDRPVRTTHEVREELRSRLTDRQLAVLRTAFLAGYYDWPRDSTAEDVADALGVASPTLHQHLRTAQRKLLSAFLDDR